MQKFLSKLTGVAARSPLPRFLRSSLYGIYSKKYGVNLEEAEKSLAEYPSFDAFFTRRLRADARLVDSNPQILVSPVDARVSACGPIHVQTLIQAKGLDYTLSELFEEDRRFELFQDGQFLTLYLAPGDCHRIYAPFDLRLEGTKRIAGRLRSVQQSVVEKVPKLFCQNERVLFHLQTEFGPAELIMVGALNVGSIESLISPGTKLNKGQELAVFHLGSTVILLFPKNVATLRDLKPGEKVKIGEKLASRR